MKRFFRLFSTLNDTLLKEKLNNIKDPKIYTKSLPAYDNDVSVLVNNYTAPALAAAFQDREKTLQRCAKLVKQNKINELKDILHPFILKEEKNLVDNEDNNKLQDNKNNNDKYNNITIFNSQHLEKIRKKLNRIPRQIAKASSKRASIIIPLCHNKYGNPSILFTLRSLTVGKHKGEVCFPGGMIDKTDLSVENACLREMHEELGISESSVKILGILRCEWWKVTEITGIAVTPVVGYIGKIKDLEQDFLINENEVENIFVIEIKELLNRKNWIIKEYSTPVFTAGPHLIWGLTAFLLDIFLKEIFHISK